MKVLIWSLVTDAATNLPYGPARPEASARDVGACGELAMAAGGRRSGSAHTRRAGAQRVRAAWARRRSTMPPGESEVEGNSKRMSELWAAMKICGILGAVGWMSG